MRNPNQWVSFQALILYYPAKGIGVHFKTVVMTNTAYILTLSGSSTISNQ